MKITFKNMIPYLGEYVRIEYLDIDEIEAKCWICDYSVIGYLDNYDLKLILADIGKKEMLSIKEIDSETGRIELKRCGNCVKFIKS